MTLWIVFYFFELLFWLWIIRWGGAKWLEGTFASGLLISTLAPAWRAEGIKLFAWISLIAMSIWFVAGLANPSLRFL